MNRATQLTPTDDVLTLDSGLEALQESPEFRGPVERLDGHESNDHLALIYESQEEQFAAAVPFMRQGLERGEHCLYIADENSRAEVLEAMRIGGIDVDAALASGALTVQTQRDAYLRNGTFDPDEMIAYLSNAIDEALEEHEGLRITGEMTWIFDDEPEMEDLIEYEGKLNRLLPEENSIALCQYNRERFPSTVFRDVLKTHPHLVYDNTVCQNFYYTPPEEFFGPDEPAHEVERMMKTLLERTEAKTELQERQRYLRRQNEITANPELSFEEKLQGLFELGCERFDLELGAMARVDAESDRFVVEQVSGAHEYLEPDLELPLSESYCTEAVDGGGETVSVVDPVGEGYGDVHVYREFGIRTYLGVCIEVEGDANRTFFFVSAQRRDEGFSEEERTFHRLMGQWVKSELERQQHERYQRALSEITSRTDLSFDEKLDELLQLGCERFDMGVGMVTREREDSFEIEKMRGEHPDLGEGALTPPLTENYCRRVVDTGESIAVADAAAAGWDGDALYHEFGLRSYAGVPVRVGDDYYGTICFIDLSPRKREFTDAERTFLDLVGEWVSHERERQQREKRLAALNTLARELMDAETATEVSEYIVEAAEETLDIPIAAIALYDDQRGELRPAARTDDAGELLDAISPWDVGDSVGWHAFVEGETRRVADPLGDADASVHPPISEVSAFPLGTYGVFLAGSTATDGFGPADFDFAETVAANTETAFDRANRERRLQDRETVLQEQNKTLERLDRVNGIIRSIDQSLVTASTREEIEEVVCDRLAASGPYELAWIGEHDAVTGEVAPKQWAGAEKGYLDDISITTDDRPESRGPTAQAIETGEPQVIDNILKDSQYGPWRQDALNRGYHATIALPLAYEGTQYGVLNVYAGQPGVFDGLEGSVLAELADTIAHALNAAETKKALVGDEVTELEFELRDRSYPLLALSAEASCTIDLDSVVRRADGRLVAYVSAAGVPAADVIEAASASASDVTVISERETDEGPMCQFEIEAACDSVVRIALEHGGVVRELTMADGTATATIELASDAEIREFVEMIRSNYPNSELMAHRTMERSADTQLGFYDRMIDRLTDRQLEALQTAYFSGYFDEPRTRTGSEIAEAMEISQPTFSSHIRSAKRKLCEQLFEAHPGRA